MPLTVTLDQKAAREKILMAANRHRIFNSTKVMTMRHIQRAVFRCRQHKLVSPEILEAAGFNPTRKR